MRSGKPFVWMLLGSAFLTLARPVSAADDDYIPIFKPLTSSVMVMVGNGWGSGFLVDRSDRLLITNYHVAGGHKEVDVVLPLFDGTGRVMVKRDYYLKKAQRYKAKVLSADSKRDLAVIQLSTVPGELPELRLAAASPRAGDRAHMIGNPGKTAQMWVYGAGTVATVSDVQMKYANGQRVGAKIVELKADGQLGRGASGGPAVNNANELIGVIAAGRIDGLNLKCIDVSEVRYFLGQTYRELASDAIKRGDYNQAVAFCDKGLRAFPDDPLTHNERGAALSYLDRFDDAIKSYTAAIAIDPTLARAYRNRGSAYNFKGKYEQAVVDATEAIKLDPGYASAYLVRAKAYHKLGKTNEAKADTARAAELSELPQKPRASLPAATIATTAQTGWRTVSMPVIDPLPLPSPAPAQPSPDTAGESKTTNKAPQRTLRRRLPSQPPSDASPAQ